MIEAYYGQIVHILGRIKDTQAERMHAAARMVADVIKANGIIYVFGCGHSHLIGLQRPQPPSFMEPPATPSHASALPESC